MAEWNGRDRRNHIDNSALMYELGVVKTKMDAVLKVKEDVDSLKKSRTYARGIFAGLGALLGVKLKGG